MVLLAACSDEKEEVKGQRVTFEVRSSIPTYVEAQRKGGETRAWTPPTGYKTYDELNGEFEGQRSMENLSIETFFTKDGDTPQQGTFFYNEHSNSWKLSMIIQQSGTYFLYGFLPVRKANGIIAEARYVKNVFSHFIVGKLIDSLIIGVLCYIVLAIMKMPYATVISVFVGITNIIPYFGPFIGAIPCAFILLLVSSADMLKFLVFILILQQFDGNILGPKIMSQTTGVSSFWVLFSILFFGGLWGIVGMIIGIPTFAVISRRINRMINEKLEKTG